MPRGRPHKAILSVSDQDRVELLRWTKRRKSSNGLAQRASIVLRCADGDPSAKVARELRTTNQ
ncbi:MAG: IS630 family transposase, partial [Candidatus Dormibacteraceae bacterium]